MHIAIATTEFVTEPTFSGGLSNFTTNLAGILRNHGHQVDVFVVADTDEVFIWEDGIRVHRVKYRKEIEELKYIPLSRLRRHALTVWCLWGMSYVINRKIKEIHKETPFSVIHFCDSAILWACCPGSIPNVLRLSSSPYLVRRALVSGELPFDYDAALKSRDLQERIYDFELRKMKTIIAPSYLVGGVIEKKLGRRVTVVESPFCTDISGMDNTLYNEKLLGKKYFLFFGTLNFLKGIHVIGQAIIDIFERYPDFYFVFQGRDSKLSWKGQELTGKELLKMFAGKYAERIIFLLPISEKKQVYGVVSHAELVVLPSRVDNLPNTCIEAMALGKVVIGTRGASFEQLITDGYNGWLIERDNPSSLLEKMDQAMRMTEEEKVLFGERAKKRLKQMSPEEFYKKIMDVYVGAMEGQ
ncbi:glycosyltransferase [Lachnospiraceae bacterium TF09-5]|jgi:glycosyltransferase involved in cell wall biosynthesis|nr:glycosyltransferase [Lachnospiraceae bacterium TF09-5]